MPRKIPRTIDGLLCTNPKIEDTDFNYRIIYGLIRADMAKRDSSYPYSNMKFIIDWDEVAKYIDNPKAYKGRWNSGFRNLGVKSWEVIRGWYHSPALPEK